MNKEIFHDFLKINFPEDQERYMAEFERYLLELLEKNQLINLVSRKTSEADFWAKHFLDSLLPCKSFNFNNKKILDFGTGGGMPGIPLKIIFPAAEVYLLDSRKKKIDAVKKIIKKLDLSECFTIVSRIEEMDHSWDGFFDLIVCRSVKILPKYKKILLKLLKHEGEILFYKSKRLEDMEMFSRYKILDLSHPSIGERKIVQIKKIWEEYE
jgi:16S rRNA (guanine527-N7)-methyltransferase